MIQKPPEGYPVSSYCTSCGNDFSADWLFDKHRIGKHEYTYSDGLKLLPPVEDGRRCMTEDEMIEAGMRIMTKEEKLATTRHRHRAEFDVSLWFDPARTEQVREAFAKSGHALGREKATDAS